MKKLLIDVKEWLNQLCGTHTFGGGGAYGKQNNLDVILEESIDVRMTNGRVISLPAGCRVGIFRRYKDHGDNIVAAAFRSEDQVVIREGGRAGIGTYQDPIGEVRYSTAMAYF